MKKIDQFTNMYSLSKTLRFELKPVGKTLENFQRNNILEEDEKKAEAYSRVKVVIDKYHKVFISRILSSLTISGLKEYSEIYLKNNRTSEDNKNLEEQIKQMRKQISNAFTKDEEYKNKLFKKDLIENILPNFDALTDEEKEDVKLFSKFTTYFQGFYDNRKNMYSGEGKSTEISYRIIDQNLPKFLDNVKASEALLSKLPKEVFESIEMEFSEALKVEIKDIFSVDYYNYCLAQEEIDLYNQIIGGIKLEDRQVKGINNYINEYNQKHSDQKPLPKLNILYKQILSDRTTMSFVIDKYNTSSEVIESISKYYYGDKENVPTKSAIDGLHKLIGIDLRDESKGIFVPAKKINEFSQEICGEWNLLLEGIYSQYDKGHTKKETDAYYKKRKKEVSQITSFSLKQIDEIIYEGLQEKIDVIDEFEKKAKEKYLKIQETCGAVKNILENQYPSEKNLHQEEADIEIIKNFLDSILDYYKYVCLISGTGLEAEKSQRFYADYSEFIQVISGIIPLYNKVRNFITEKPYSIEKIKLNFGNPQLLGGWDKNKEAAYRTTILRQGEKYYLCVMDGENKTIFETVPEGDCPEVFFEKMEYKYLPNPHMMLPKGFFTKKGVETFNPSKEILEIYNGGNFKKGNTFNIDDCHKLIDFYKDKINLHPDWKNFDFHFSDTSSYTNIAEFYQEVAHGGYSIAFSRVPERWLLDQVDCGKIYLFQIYNKDFSKYSKGNPNLHTLYFKALFDPENMKSISYKLSGGAEMFYRKKSLHKEKPTHPANQPIRCKNPHTDKKESVFDYDLYKDKRYMVDKFLLHLPIELNYKGQGNEYINADVRYTLRNSEDNYVIGIDRGERHLLYVCVIDSKGKIVEQYSLNTIKNSYNNKTHEVDYHQLLSEREASRTSERRNWKNIQNIKELKQGYLSQAVSKICELVEKHDAIVVMENLNTGFKNSRIKIEKQVYQKFENMLIEKLRYRVCKTKDVNEPGGLYKAYQLANSNNYTNEKSTQNGFIFYIPAWNTSKIDPTTGFVNMLYTKYESIEKTKIFLEKVDEISYNEKEDVFEFEIDYDKFKPVNADYVKNWKISSYGERIKTEKDKNGIYTSASICLTGEFKKIFSSYGIDYEKNIKEQLLDKNDATFYKSLMYHIRLMLQMRNSESGGERDFLISPVKNKEGKHYCSEEYFGDDISMPQNADANGAYNIALKGLWAIEKIKNAPEDKFEKESISITNKEWLEFIQKRTM